jgi:hypothetical protein
MILISLDELKKLKKRDRVIKVCDNCQKIKNVSVESLRKYKSYSICKECNTKKNLTGIPKSEEQKIKISKAKKGKPIQKRTEEYIQKMTGKGNPFYGKKHSQESLDRMMETRKKNGVWEPAYREALKHRNNEAIGNAHRGRKPSLPLRNTYVYSGVKFRSSWELAFAIYLTENCYSWEYEPCTFKLPNGTGYTPDFFVKSTNTFYEVKSDYYNPPDKFYLACEVYNNHNWKLMNQKALSDLGILKGCVISKHYKQFLNKNQGK